MVEIVDFHCHPDLYNDNFRTIKLAKEYNFKIIAMTNLPVLYKKYCELFKNEEAVIFSLGYHPQLVSEYPNEIDTFLSYIHDTKFIGEIGLDNSLNQLEYIEKQKEIFGKIIFECNRIGNKIISIHSKKADSIIFDFLQKGSCIYILHWYTGNLKKLLNAMTEDENIYISVNSNMINTINGRKIIEEVSLTKILLETDAPFTNLTKKTYHKDILWSTANSISKIKNCELQLVLRSIEKNSKKIILG